MESLANRARQSFAREALAQSVAAESLAKKFLTDWIQTVFLTGTLDQESVIDVALDRYPLAACLESHIEAVTEELG